MNSGVAIPPIPVRETFKELRATGRRSVCERFLPIEGEVITRFALVRAANERDRAQRAA